MKITLASLDHPLFFLFFLSLALIPIAVAVWLGARKLGVF